MYLFWASKTLFCVDAKLKHKTILQNYSIVKGLDMFRNLLCFNGTFKCKYFNN